MVKLFQPFLNVSRLFQPFLNVSRFLGCAVLGVFIDFKFVFSEPCNV
jgi:hypothetical protein